MRLMVSRNRTPGSAQSQVARISLSHSAWALTVENTSPSNTRSKVSPRSRACMKLSTTPAEMLKRRSSVSFCLAPMKISMSGWSIRSTPIWAPRRSPAEEIVPHTASKMSMKERGPEALLPMERMSDLRGRMREKS